jgi:hypothetical protein
MPREDSFLDVQIEEAEFAASLAAVERMHEAVTPRWIKSTQRRNLKPMVAAMKANSKSTRIARMIGVTTARRRAGELGAKVGVVKNDATLFPKISAPALGSIIEYGVSEERFRTLRAGVFVTGRQSTGTMPAAPFLRPAWDAHVRSFMESTEQAIADKIEREA